MANIAGFDALGAVQALEGAGMDRRQAEAVAAISRAAAESGRGDLAAKADLSAAISKLEGRIAALEARITWRMVAIVGAINALTVALLRLLPAG